MVGVAQGEVHVVRTGVPLDVRQRFLRRAKALVQGAERIGQQLKKEQAGFVQSYLLVPDAALSTPLPRESTEGRVLQPMLVIETSSADAALSDRA